MRELSISYGFASLALDGSTGVYAENISGLGFTDGADFYDMGGSNYEPLTDPTDEMEAIDMDFVFTPRGGYEPYSRYKAVMAGLLDGSALTLTYTPSSAVGSFQRLVYLASVAKTELAARSLRVPVKLMPLEPWHAASPPSYAMTLDDGVLTYDIDIPEGQLAFPFVLDVEGPAANPVVTVEDASGSELYRCEIYNTIASGQTLYIDTRPHFCLCQRLSSGTETDMTQYANLSYDIFKLLPAGVPCTVKVSADADLTGDGTIQPIYYWRTV